MEKKSLVGLTPVADFKKLFVFFPIFAVMLGNFIIKDFFLSLTNMKV